MGRKAVEALIRVSGMVSRPASCYLTKQDLLLQLRFRGEEGLIRFVRLLRSTSGTSFTGGGMTTWAFKPLNFRHQNQKPRSWGYPLSNSFFSLFPSREGRSTTLIRDYTLVLLFGSPIGRELDNEDICSLSRCYFKQVSSLTGSQSPTTPHSH